MDDCRYEGIEPLVTAADYYMEVAGLPISFVAQLPAIQQTWGPQFTSLAMQAAWRRAASTLAQMGLIRGVTFQFLRLGIPWSVAEVAAYVHASVPDVEAWEAETAPILPSVWLQLAEHAGKIDGRYIFQSGALPPSDYRPRVIRIYPDIPQVTMQQPPDCGCGVDGL